jgi:single-strand DNA-binding protein
MEIIDRVTADVTVNETKAGKNIVNFSIAINNTYKTKGSDEVTKVTIYINCAYRMNPGIATYLTKGCLVECAGRIGVNAWTGKDGDTKATRTFHVNSIKLHGKSNGNSATLAQVVTMLSSTAELVADDLPF